MLNILPPFFINTNNVFISLSEGEKSYLIQWFPNANIENIKYLAAGYISVLTKNPFQEVSTLSIERHIRMYDLQYNDNKIVYNISLTEKVITPILIVNDHITPHFH